MDIQNFQPGPATVVTVALPVERRLAPGVHCLKLSGPIGEDQPVSLRAVRSALVGCEYNHLHVQINSTGGIVTEAFRVYDYLKALPGPISIEATGQCLSSAMIILMAGDFRFATTETEFLNHPTNTDRSSLEETLTSATLRERAARLEATDLRIAELFAARTGFDVGWFLEEAKTETALDPADAIQSGLLHEVAGLPKRIDPLWPELVKAIPKHICSPRYLVSQNYFAACRAAASLWQAES